MDKIDSLNFGNAYKDFLREVAFHPAQTHYPSKEADMDWHKHLEQSSYMEDCRQIFGAILEHIPCGEYCAAVIN